MTQKPHRTLLGRVSGYADEAAAYLRRRRAMRQPFARVYYPGGRSARYAPETDAGRALFEAAAALIEIAGPAPRTQRLQRTQRQQRTQRARG
jgi:hypothetical protein